MLKPRYNTSQYQIKATIKTKITREIIHKAERKLLKECCRTINDISELDAFKRDKCVEHLASVLNNHGLLREHK